MFKGGEGMRIQGMTDGTANTIMVVEVTGQGVHWSEPVDLDASQMQVGMNAGGGNDISSHHPGGAQVVLGDGSVRFIADTINPQTLQNLIDPQDGQMISGF